MRAHVGTGTWLEDLQPFKGAAKQDSCRAGLLL